MRTLLQMIDDYGGRTRETETGRRYDVNPYTKKELDSLRAGVEAGHHPEYVGRLVATIDSLQRKLNNAHEAIRLLMENGQSLE